MFSNNFLIFSVHYVFSHQNLKNIFLVSLAYFCKTCHLCYLTEKNFCLRRTVLYIKQLVAKCSKEPWILDISIVGETWMKKCKKNRPHTWRKLLTLAVNFIWRRLLLTQHFFHVSLPHIQSGLHLGFKFNSHFFKCPSESIYRKRFNQLNPVRELLL